jgi:hypothetical protein
MKIAAVVPIGYVDRWGYERHIDDYIGSFAPLCDVTILTEQYRDAPGAAELAERLGAVLLSDERTWFPDDGRGRQVFSWAGVNASEDAALDEARVLGCDAAVITSCNWYASFAALLAVKDAIYSMLQDNQPYARFYVRYQLGARLFHSDLLYSGLANLKHRWQYREVLGMTNGEASAPSLAGDFSGFDDAAIVDAALEITADELRAKCTEWRCNVDLKPKNNPVFSWDYYRRYYTSKFRRKMPADDPPVGVGAIVAQATRADYVSNIILGELGL